MRDLAPEFYVEFRPADGKPPIVAPLRRPGQDDVTLIGANLPAPRRAGLSTYRTIRTEGDTELRARISLEEDGGVLVIARPIESVVHTRSVLFAVLATATAGAVLAVLVVGVWLVRIGLRPLIDVERSAARITDDNIAERVPGEDPTTEVGRLAGAINSMLDRLQGPSTSAIGI
ncbi:MAG: HAMP domain-containing protein [Ilumatobacteraceae bacterium]